MLKWRFVRNLNEMGHTSMTDRALVTNSTHCVTLRYSVTHAESSL